MAYIGRGLDKISNIEVLDAITFTDSAGPYNITQSSTAFVPAASNALVISIDGVVQDPGSYTTSVATITFDSVMAATSTMNFMYQIGVGVITAPSDGSVTEAKIATDAVTTAKIKDLNVTVGKLPASVDLSTKTITLPASVSGLGTGITNTQLAGSIDVTTKITGIVPTVNLGSGTASSSTILYGDQTYKTEPTTDLTPVNQDIITLALRQSVDNNSAKYNLPNGAVTQFESDADYDSGGSTDILRNASEYISAATFVSGAYSNDANTVALLHFDGNFTDSSSNAITFTGQNSIVTSTAQKKFGTQSVLFDGVNQYISTGDLSSLSSPAAPGTGDFTVDYWVYFDEAWGTNRRHYSFGNNGDPATGSANSGLTGSWNSGTSWNWYNGSNAGLSGLTEYAYNQWDHYATMKTGGTLYLYINGVQIGSDTLGAFNQLSGDANAFLGIRSGSSAEWMKGYIDEWRYSDNARYSTPGNGSTAFTPNEDSTTVSATGTALGTTNVPTAPVTSVSGVILMKNGYGTNVMGTDVKVYFTADNSNWTEASSYTSAGTFSTGVTQITLGQTTVTSGSDVRWKIEFANQVASSKEAYIYGMGTNY